ncbi:MAG: DUF1592 domain-containing protein [Planctomycetes bacterium]|nr:DUF1592 domain-containing protein [Planctomycetota bacterium]
MFTVFPTGARVLPLTLLAWVGATPASDVPAGFAERVRPFLERHCTACHDAEKHKGDLVLDARDGAAAAREPGTWEKVLARLEAGEMPPPKRPRPDPGELEAVAEWIRGLLAGHASSPPDPGRVTLRRLNRAEYDNTLRDLLGIDLRLSARFPSDDVGNGFDNMGEVLSMPPVLLERYLEAAEMALEAALGPVPVKARAFRFDVEGPLAAEPPRAPGRARVLACEPAEAAPEACAREILRRFARRAYRRPVPEEEGERLLGLSRSALEAGETFEGALRVALEAVLVSPRFLFRVEADAEPGAGRVRALDEHELASRLSYFLWSSMPDDELFRLAEEGRLRRDLGAQVRRMLVDPRSRALVDDFAAQWLTIRNLEAVSPDRKRFSAFDQELRAAMRRETELCFERILREDRSVLELLDADYTFLNERLARHYGIQGIVGPDFRLVHLADPRRGGVLTQASVLTVTSNPTRTSPVKRGKWVLEQILGTPPPPPPPDVPELKESGELRGTLRQQLEQHRADPSCATCHERMDPLGFGLENYDAVGAWRDADGDQPVDPSGVLPDGRRFDGPLGLKRLLVEDAAAFARCLAEKMLTFALGRGLEYADRAAVDEIVRRVKENGFRFSSVVDAIVESEPFQKRRGDRGSP